MGRRIEVLVPATTANLGAGFDCLGMALQLYNSFEFELGAHGFSVIGEGAQQLRENQGQLVYGAWAAAFAHGEQTPPPVQLHIGSLIPIGRGIGSSATAVVAGLYAANHLGELQISDADLLRLAATLEGHPDNVAPALFGGLVVTTAQESKIDYVILAPREELQVILAIPDFELSTTKARSVLPETVPYGDAVFNTSRVALFIAAWTTQRWDLLGRAMEDRLHQPYRAPLVPGLDGVMVAAIEAGAVGAALSGAGPTVVALAEGKAQSIGDAMQKAFADHGIGCQIVVTSIARQGVCLAR